MGGEVTMICVDTSITNLCLFHDQIHAVEIYCEGKLKAHPDNLVGIVTSSWQLDNGRFLAPINCLEKVTYCLNRLEGCEYEYTNLLGGFERWFRPDLVDMKKRIVVFTGGPLFSTAGELPESLKKGRVVLDVIDFCPLGKKRDSSKAKALVDAMNDNNENADGRYFLIENDGFSLLHHMLRSSSILAPLVAKEEAPVSCTSMLLMEGEVTMICVDTSITNLCWFHDQIHAVEIYCERKLKAHPDSLFSIARFGQQDFSICLYPTNCLENVTYILGTLKPLEQEYTDLLQGIKFLCLGWFGQAMKKRILVFSGSPLLSTTGELPEPIPPFLKKGRVGLDVIDFGPRVKGKEDSKAKYLKALVDAMNDNNENEDGHYFLIENDGFSLSHHISSSIIPEEAPIIRIPDIPDDIVEDSCRFNDVEEVADSGWITDEEGELFSDVEE